ncbi:hypothetical protein RchiOBHm_Chr1g0321561 [Rosa chinensis]|uniref:Uncharacterized protein n=1 Tax=Rosa chinensis TaxID=74649 RepID=A0A2P6S8Y1_ROSCH|nr:hypothetical protein RchiOBHm_Chr1g0321561 [Rosa chinensis]
MASLITPDQFSANQDAEALRKACQGSMRIKFQFKLHNGRATFAINLGIERARIH